jgi:RHS repeat-associated protein
MYTSLNWEPVAVIEGGVVSLVRTDHIGRPVFATNATTGVQTWTASYDPFGGVRTVIGTPIAARFPGQWFQAESGLHQNWMRDYDPTTGRYLQADPLGLVDGASVYGYALQNPVRYTDPRGETSTAANSQASSTAYPNSRPEEQICNVGGRQDCIRMCTALALPTVDYGISFFRCLRACESDGRSGFDDWDKYFP